MIGDLRESTRLFKLLHVVELHILISIDLNQFRVRQKKDIESYIDQYIDDGGGDTLNN